MSDELFEMLNIPLPPRRLRPWQLTIKGVRELIQADQENETPEYAREIAPKIAAVLRSYLPSIQRLGVRAYRDFTDLIGTFECVTDCDELNDCLEDMYNLSDDYRIWHDLA